MNSDWVIIQKEANIASLKVLSWHLLGETEEIMKNHSQDSQ